MDIQKTMEFILEQQAANDIAISRLAASSERHDAALGQLTSDVEALTEHFFDLTQETQKLASLMQSGHSRLTEAQLATDQRLNALIGVVERLLPPRHNAR